MRDIAENILLAGLPVEDLKALAPQATIVAMRQGASLFKQGEGQLYFPLSGMLTLINVFENGSTVETEISAAMAWCRYRQSRRFA